MNPLRAAFLIAAGLLAVAFTAEAVSRNLQAGGWAGWFAAAWGGLLGLSAALVTWQTAAAPWVDRWWPALGSERAGDEDEDHEDDDREQ